MSLNFLCLRLLISNFLIPIFAIRYYERANNREAEMGMTQNPAEIVDLQTLEKVLLYDEEGEVFRTGLFWEKRPAILIFLRHFGCIACRAHAKDVWRNKEKYEAKGAQIFFIGNGKPQMIKAFK